MAETVRHSRGRALLVVGLVGVTLLVSGCAAVSSSELAAPASVSVAPTPSPTPSVAPWEVIDPGEYGTGDPAADMAQISGDLVAGVQAIREFGPRVYPDVYTSIGSGVPGDADVLRIYSTDRDPAVERDFVAASGLPAERVAFFTSLRSEKDALALQQRLMDDLASDTLSSAALPELNSFGPDADGLVVIGLTGHDPDQIELLWNRYGPDIRFVTDQPETTATAT